MRQLLYSKLVAIPGYNPLLLGDQNDPNRIRVYQWGSLGTDDIPEQPPFPFVVIFENPSVVHQEVQDQNRSPETRNFQIYCYDEHGLGYLQIEHVLRLARDTVKGLPLQVSPSGARCTAARWSGMSVDSRDPDYQANMKFLTVQLVASQPA